MAKCFMCGSPIPRGILCEKCDKPRRTKPAESDEPAPPKRSQAPEPVQPVMKVTAAPKAQPTKEAAASTSSSAAASSQPAMSKEATAPAVEIDPFPKAPVLTFPIEAASPALTSVVSVLVASGVPSILVGADRTVRFVSDEAKHLFGVPQSDLPTLKAVEEKTGLRIAELSVPTTAGLRIRETNVLYSLVPLSGGASGAVLIFRYADAESGRAPFVAYVRETVLGPLRSLRESLLAAARTRLMGDPLLKDAAATLDMVLSSLEMAPEVGEAAASLRSNRTVTDVVHQVAERFRPFADLKGIQMQVDVQELEERFNDSESLADALGILMDNALHYVPAGGQVVLGVRWMEHKGKPLLLFFVMDNGPVVPEHLRQEIFEPAFVWNPQSAERTGRSLFRAREFAVAHSGSVWVESKTGKACTFFLRVRPDGVQ